MNTPTKFFTITVLAVALTLGAQPVDTVKIKPVFYEVNDYVDDNEHCLRCHGEMKYALEDAYGRIVTHSICPDKLVDRELYYAGVHKSFACTDCHSAEFITFPHPLDPRMEEKLLCMDCHGYDETFAKYHFEEAEMEFSESIHNMDEFTCWKCHDPHSYKAFMRNAADIKEAVLYDNNMCLKCHADFGKFTLLTNRPEINVVESHDWLPNQIAHFKKIRCIECHSEINDTVLIAHKILPKTQAVQNCTECHSKDSRLLHTLYKFESLEKRKAGFMNGIMINNSYVIGANQNVLLNRLSLLVFGLTMVVILFHSYLRIKKQKKS